MKIYNKSTLGICIVLMFTLMFSTTAFAAGDVAGAIEGTWKDPSGQIKTKEITRGKIGCYSNIIGTGKIILP